MLKNRIKFIALTLVFAFLLSGCSTKKTGQEWNSYNENSEWSYFMPMDVDRDVVPFVFPGKYVVDIEIETQNEFKTYIERYTELETCKLLWSSIFVTLMANKIGGLQFGIYRNCQISSRVFHTAVAALPLTKANRSDFE